MLASSKITFIAFCGESLHIETKRHVNKSRPMHDLTIRKFEQMQFSIGFDSLFNSSIMTIVSL